MNIDLFISEQKRIDERSLFSAINQVAREVEHFDSRRAARKFNYYYGDFTRTARRYGVEDDVLRLVNKNLGTGFRSLDDISRITYMFESINENRFKDWWNGIKKSIKSILPLDKIKNIVSGLSELFGPDGKMREIIIHAVIWIYLVSRKFQEGR